MEVNGFISLIALFARGLFADCDMTVKDRVILISLAALLAVSNGLVSHFAYQPLIMIGLYFMACFAIGWTYPHHLLFWNIASPLLIGVAHVLTIFSFGEIGYFEGTIHGSLIYAVVLSVSATLMARAIRYSARIWHWPIFSVSALFVLTASVLPKRVPSDGTFDLLPPVVFNYAYANINHTFPVYCGTCMAGDRYDYFKWSFDDLVIQDSLLICIHYDPEISCLIRSFEIGTSDSIAKVLSKYFSMTETDSVISRSGYQITRDYRYREWEHRKLTANFRIEPAELSNCQRAVIELLMFPHFLTGGIL